MTGTSWSAPAHLEKPYSRVSSIPDGCPPSSICVTHRVGSARPAQVIAPYEDRKKVWMWCDFIVMYAPISLNRAESLYGGNYLVPSIEWINYQQILAFLTLESLHSSVRCICFVYFNRTEHFPIQDFMGCVCWTSSSWSDCVYHVHVSDIVLLFCLYETLVSR